MKQLTVEILAAYLPFGLQLIFEKSGRIITMESCYNNGAIYITDGGIHSSLSIWNFKPILHPKEYLHQLKDEIFKRWGSNVQETAKKTWLDIIIERMIDTSYKALPYDQVQFMLENHIDVFSLIPENLAIAKTN